MDNELATFDYRSLNTADQRFIRRHANRIRDAAKRTVEGIVLIGQWLNEAKQRLPHGAWLPWLKAEFGWSQPTAWRFMQVFKFAKRNPELFTVNNLEIDVKALYLLAAPKTPKPVREEAVRLAQTGERITHATAKELVQSYKLTHDFSIPVVEASGEVITPYHNVIDANSGSRNRYDQLRKEIEAILDECRRRRKEQKVQRQKRNWNTLQTSKLELVYLLDYIEDELARLVTKTATKEDYLN
jgi:hypothetical protein